MPNPLIKSFAKKAGKNEVYVDNLWKETAAQLHTQGMKEEDKRFYPYLTTILKKKLKITEQSKVLKRFKEFLKEQIDKKDKKVV
jgi:hypothetical protein